MARITKEQQVLIDKKLEYVVQRQRAGYAKSPVVKKNYWDHETGWLNVYAIVQAASEAEKRRVYNFLREYFGDS